MNNDLNALWGSYWRVRPDTTYLNHGSFGLSPTPVRDAQRRWQDALEEQAMDFYLRQYEPAWFESRDALAKLVSCDPRSLVFTENSTAAMNIVANSVELNPSDEVILNDHEYGAVVNIWNRACQRSGARSVVVELPVSFQHPDEITAAICNRITAETKLIVLSHITSHSAIRFPVEDICRQAKDRGVAICIDGPHAIAHVPLSIQSMDPDFYTASCHKWLCGPFGSGFLYVAPKHQPCIVPTQTSWGRIDPANVTEWFDEHIWSGTRDPSPYLALPTAIEFMDSVGLAEFQHWSHELVRYARQELLELWGEEPLTPDSLDWYGSMVSIPLPSQLTPEIQQRLWLEHSIEVPVPSIGDRHYIRVSAHLYNNQQQFDMLIEVLKKITRSP